jgi:hypothetical protein
MTALAGRLAAMRPGLREVLLFAGALLAYQASRAVVIGDASTAISHGWDVLRLERALGLDVEDAVQDLAVATPGMAESLNAFYLAGHLPITAVFFVWLFSRRRRAYPLLRDGFLVANAIALCVFVAFPTAPPRLTEGAGLADTLQAESAVDLHGGPLAGWFNPYAAVPSMHFGYSLLIGVAVAALARSWAARLAGLAYPVLVFAAITATGNHFLLDAAAGALVMALGIASVAAARRIRGLLSLRWSTPRRDARRREPALGADRRPLIIRWGVVLRAQSARPPEGLAPLGLRPKHFALLHHIALAEGSSQRQLGRRLGLDPRGLVGSIDELERRGLLEVEPTPTTSTAGTSASPSSSTAPRPAAGRRVHPPP